MAHFLDALLDLAVLYETPRDWVRFLTLLLATVGGAVGGLTVAALLLHLGPSGRFLGAVAGGVLGHLLARRALRGRGARAG